MNLVEDISLHIYHRNQKLYKCTLMSGQPKPMFSRLLFYCTCINVLVNYFENKPKDVFLKYGEWFW